MRRLRVTAMSTQGCTWLAILEGGYRLSAYRDGAGVWTISAGVTFYSKGIRVKRGDRLESAEVAESLFRQRLMEYEACVDAHTRDDISQTEFDALVAFAYNVGMGAFRTCTAVRRFNDRRISSASVAEAMGWYNKITDPTTGKLVVDRGVVERRRCEAYLLMFGLYKTQGQPKPE